MKAETEWELRGLVDEIVNELRSMDILFDVDNEGVLDRGTP